MKMKVVNSSFNFTVKVGTDHYGGQFDYAKNGEEVVKISFRRLPKNRGNGLAYEQINYLRKLNGQWIIWDVKRRQPKYNTAEDTAVYGVFREAFGLSLLDEA